MRRRRPDWNVGSQRSTPAAMASELSVDETNGNDSDNDTGVLSVHQQGMVAATSPRSTS